jgi:SSS family solute:Na+ symporter
MNLELLSIIVGTYTLVVGYLGWLGYKRTKTASDYLVGGREIHPVLMALAYGSTFISTSAIVGFAGVAGMMGLGLLWLVFLNIFIGIFIAFVIFGRPTRKIGAQLDAHTFPELLGRRYKSFFIQGFSGTIIALLMPLYAAAVMIGGARFLEVQLQIDYKIALFVFSVVVVAYVFFGGLKGVIYTDALQGTLMFISMVILLAITYQKLGWFSSHAELTALASQVPASMAAKGHQGWTAMPKFASPLWWQMVSTIILGVGIGVLAQPQLAVRYMTVKSGKELYRALIPGSIFILVMTGAAYMIGALSNLYFFKTTGKIAMDIAVDAVTGKPNVDKIMPLFINQTMPQWFSYLFMLCLLAAAMSTMSGQFHAIGTSFGRDIYQQAFAKGKHQERTVPIAKGGIFIGFVITMILAYNLGPGIIAIATSLFFGMCAAVFLPAYTSALFWKNSTREGVITGMLTGILVWGFWILLIHEKESAALGVCNLFTGKPSLFTGTQWAVIDPILISLPASALVTILVSLATQKKNGNK